MVIAIMTVTRTSRLLNYSCDYSYDLKMCFIAKLCKTIQASSSCIVAEVVVVVVVALIASYG